jgi:hypothetical protein
MRIEITVINGCEGESLAIHNYRVAGPKPWGGGTIFKQWSVDIKDIIHAINGLFDPRASIPKTELDELDILKAHITSHLSGSEKDRSA